ncbi:hypothetical protein LBMAG49_06320 [Planctomycetota bacterium]|nr:hypothetical protein LBMAG49_06320 [Planctomycetota bacterium]
MRRTYFRLLATLSLASCGLTSVVDRLQEHSPPPEFGRPSWVRGIAGAGGWFGGIVGAVVSIVVIPISYPISLAAGDGLGGEMSHQEFLLLPMTFGAVAGHCLFGAPPDLLDFTFRRAWVHVDDPSNTFELQPMDPPAWPKLAPVVPVPEPQKS